QGAVSSPGQREHLRVAALAPRLDPAPAAQGERVRGLAGAATGAGGERAERGAGVRLYRRQRQAGHGGRHGRQDHRRRAAAHHARPGRAGAGAAQVPAGPAAAPRGLMPFAGRHVVLGVSGGIACYKSCTLARRLTEDGAVVDVVLTASAAEFVRPVTFEALTGRPVLTSLWERDRALAHIGLAQQPDLAIVAPATAHLLARAALGMA